MDSLCGIFYSSFMILFGFDKFVLFGSVLQFQWCIIKTFLHFQSLTFFIFLSLLSLHKLQGGERRERKQKKKKPWRHTKTMVEKILTRRIHQYQKKSQTIWVIQKCRGSLAFMWPTPVIVSNLPWYYWICLVEVFSTVQWCYHQSLDMSSRFFFLFPFLSLLSLLNLVFKNFAI